LSAKTMTTERITATMPIFKSKDVRFIRLLFLNFCKNGKEILQIV
jgi:hypothetical protein